LINYSLEEAKKILKEHDNSQINCIPHAQFRAMQRNIDMNYAVKCLNNKPESFTKETENRFKLIYPQKDSKTLKLTIIIEIQDNEDILFITFY